MTSLISTERKHYTKLLPTINLLDITTVFAWSKMRKVVKDYGRRMNKRQELLLPLIFIYMIIVIAFIWLTHFKIIKIDKKLLDEIAPFCYIDFVLLTILTLRLVYSAARVNWYYDFHFVQIEKIKKLIQEIYNFREHFFGIERSNKFSLIKKEGETVFRNEMSDPVVSAFVEQLAAICPKEKISEYLHDLMKTFKALAEEIEMEVEFNQIKILQVPVTMEFFMHMLIACVLSAVGAIEFIFIDDK